MGINSLNVKKVIIVADEKDKKKMIALCLLLVIEQIEDFYKNIRPRKETRSAGHENTVVIESLNQEQVDLINKEGRQLLLFPLFFLIRSFDFKSPEYSIFVSIAVGLSEITDNYRKGEDDAIAFLARMKNDLAVYLVPEDGTE